MEKKKFEIDSLDGVEPLKTNRYIVDLSDYGVPQWAVRSVDFGDGGMLLNVMGVVGGGRYIKTLSETKKIKEVEVKLLDPTNVPVMYFTLRDVKIKSVIPCRMDYKSDEFLEFSVRCTYRKITYENIVFD